MKQLIIAEVGSVHDGSFGNACKLIEAAADCGADVVKFQTHIAEAETLAGAPSPKYFTGEPRYEYFERTGFSELEWAKLKTVCDENKVQFMSSPFSIEAIDLLERIGTDHYKVPSGEVTNIPLLERLIATRKPVFLSSGMSDWGELDAAVSVLRKYENFVVMQCTSAYPCPPERVGLNIISEMRDRYGVTIGFSDHTLGCGAAYAAAALGADVVEKHFTFSKLMYGSDAANSMEPEEFKLFVSELREIWKMRENKIDKNDITPFMEMKRIFQKSVVAKVDLPAGHIITFQDLAFKKPDDGVSAADYKSLIGQKLDSPIAKNQFFLKTVSNKR